MSIGFWAVKMTMMKINIMLVPIVQTKKVEFILKRKDPNYEEL